MAEGIDVYVKYQSVTSWARVRAADIQFAYVKLSDGVNTRDDGGYVGGARAAGIKAGGYHYAQPGDPVSQANLLVNRCAVLGALDLAPALDLEAPFVPGAAAANFAIAFLKQVKARGQRPCLYANNSMLSGVLPAIRAAVPDVIVWAARYGADPTVSHDVHQYADNGSVPGITGTVDRNRGVVPLNITSPPPGGSTPSAQPSEVSMLERRTVGSSSETTSTRVLLSGTDRAAVIIRPNLDASGSAPVPVWLGNIFAWGNNNAGVGNNPNAKADFDPRISAPWRFELPGALWADVEYSSNAPFTIECY